MSKNRYLGAMGVILVACACFLASFSARAQNPTSVALTGQISSQEEGPMEGVVVSAKGAGTNITISVVSDDKGRFSFPRTRLKPNKYSLSIRAVGYEIGSPSNFEPPPKQAPLFVPDKHTAPLSLPVEVAANKTIQLDLKLTKAADLASQLSKAEWLVSFPGTDAQKRMAQGCSECHSLERVVKSKYDAVAFLDVMKRMSGYPNGSLPSHPVKWPQEFVRTGLDEPASAEANKNKAQYLSTLNLSSAPHWAYPLKTFPRPKGEATRALYTEYDLPRREAAPHDAAVGPDGMVWYSDYGSLYLGRLDPRTGQVKEWRVPVTKPEAPATGSLSIEFDKEGNVWMGTLYQATVYRFDTKKEKFSSWSAPGEYNNNDSRTSMTAPQNSHVDGKVWFDNAQANQVIHRIDLATGQVETVTPYGETGGHKKGHSLYSIASDPSNNLVFTDYEGSQIGIIDAKTRKVSLYPTPTPNARPRRGALDSQGRFWFGENTANRIGMFDTKTKQFQEWVMPTPRTDPYDVMLDKNGEAWTSGMVTDQVIRLNPKTGKMVEYLMPKPTQTRRVFVDNSTTPVTFWVGSNLGASIVKLEPLE